jgi:lactoylglutathione lyase
MGKLNLGLAHVGIFVKDIEVSKKFYCDVLDFTIDHENSLYEGSNVIKLAFISSGTCLIELVQLPAINDRTDGPIDHLAFCVKDIEKVKATLESRGVRFETEEITFAPHFFDKGDRWIFFKGPDGEKLEINEVL